MYYILMSSTRSFPQVSLGTPIWMQSAIPSTIELILPNTSVEIAADLTVGNNIYVTSSKDKKKEINDIGISPDTILSINPKQFIYKNDPSEKLHYGFIAEEVEKVFPTLVTSSSQTKAVNYLEMVPLLLLKINDLQKQIDELKK
jgi:hypothetical protein|tara:strand:+ start:1527 stop:1958 length:432 start_codon:yes stop_codon:yes gene_type:complete